MASTVGFLAADYIIFVLVLLISVAIGCYHAFSGGKNQTSKEFHLGNRSIRILPLLISLMVSNQSSVMMLGFPVETYLFGAKVSLSVFGYIVAFLIAVRIVVPLFHPLTLTSVNEYFELRYKARTVRIFASVCGALFDIIYSGLVIYGPAIALEGAVGVPMWVSIIVISASSVLYTSIGGIKAVVWTDVFQFIILYSGVLAVLIQGTILSGGVKTVWEINAATGRTNIFNFSPDLSKRYTFWSLVIGGSIKAIVIPFRQSTVQRICCTKRAQDAKIIFYVIGPVFVVTTLSAMFMGFVAYAYYTKIGCDPIKSRQISSINQLMPFLVADIFRGYPGMSGLFMASLFSASLSTVSSNLSGLSAITLEDFIKPHFRSLSEQKAAKYSKYAVVVYGILSMGLAFLVDTMKGSLYKVALSISSVFAAPLAGIFLYSAFWPRASHMSCLIGGITGMVVILWISMGQSFSTTLPVEPKLPLAPISGCGNLSWSGSVANDFNISSDTSIITDGILNMTTMTSISHVPSKTRKGLDILYSVSFYWFETIGLLVIIPIAILVSYFTGSSTVGDSRYILSFSQQFFPCLPHKCRVWLSCCVDVENMKKVPPSCDVKQEEQALELISDSRVDERSLDVVK